MASLVPENALRLTATAFVGPVDLARVDRAHIIRAAATKMAEEALRKLLEDCTKAEDYRGHVGKLLLLDCYVLAPSELHSIIATAREEGTQDALRWHQTHNVQV